MNMQNPTESYIMQRISGALVALLSIWILFFIIPAVGGIMFGSENTYYDSIQSIFGTIQSVTCLIIFIICSLYHSIIGLKSIINDYISCDVMKKVANFMIISGSFGAMIFLVVFVLTAHFNVRFVNTNQSMQDANNATINNK